MTAMLWKNHYLLPPPSLSPFKQRWDLSMILLVVYNCVMIPMEIAFVFGEREGYDWLNIVEYVIDSFFWMDMALNLRTCYFDSDGELVVDPMKVLRNYGTTWLPLDLAATWPWEAMAPNAPVSVIGALKLPRLFRLSRLLKVLDSMRAANAFRGIKLVAAFLFLAHWVGCIWWRLGESMVLADFGTSWLFRATRTCLTLGPEDYDRAMIAHDYFWFEEDDEAQRVLRYNWKWVYCDDPTGDTAESAGLSVAPSMLYHGDIIQQYFSTLYWALSMLMKSAYVGPDTTSEKAVACFMVMVGSCVFCVVLGNVVAMITSYDKYNALFRDQISTLHQFCNSRRVPLRLQRRLFQYTYAEWSLNQGFSTNHQLKDFAFHMQNNTLFSIHSSTILTCPLFIGFDLETTKFILRTLQKEVVLQKAVLIHADQPVGHLYVLVKGTLQCTRSEATPSLRESDDPLDLSPGPDSPSSSFADVARAAMADQSGPQYAKPPGSLAASCASTASENGSIGASMRDDSPGGAKGIPTMRSAAGLATKTQVAGRNWKKMLKKVVIERPGSVVGFADPLSAGLKSVVQVSAISQSEVLVWDRRSLSQMLVQCPENKALDFARRIETEFNKLMLSVKARGQQVHTAAQREVFDDKRDKARVQALKSYDDFCNQDNLDSLSDKVDVLEDHLERTAARASSVRYSIETQLSAIASVIKEGLKDFDVQPMASQQKTAAGRRAGGGLGGGLGGGMAGLELAAFREEAGVAVDDGDTGVDDVSMRTKNLRALHALDQAVNADDDDDDGMPGVSSGPSRALQRGAMGGSRQHQLSRDSHMDGRSHGHGMGLKGKGQQEDEKVGDAAVLATMVM